MACRYLRVCVQYSSDEEALFDPYLLGIERLLNPSIKGFNLGDGVEMLLHSRSLFLEVVNSYLTLSISEELKLEILSLPQMTDSVTATADVFNLCLYTIPDPYAEALWQGRCEALNPVLLNDVLPHLLSFTSVTYGLSESFDLNSIHKIVHVLITASSANILDVVTIHEFLIVFLDSIQYSDYFTPPQQCQDAQLDLITLLHSSQNAGNDLEVDELPVKMMQDRIDTLLTNHLPYGHLVLLSLCQISKDLRHSQGVSRFGTYLSMCAISKVSQYESHSDIDRLLLSCLNVLRKNNTDLCRNIEPKKSNIESCKLEFGHESTSVENLNMTLTVSYFLSNLGWHQNAIDGLWRVVEEYHQREYSSVQLWLVTLCELMQCLNLTGQEERAIQVIPLILHHLAQDDFTQQILHTRDGTVAIDLAMKNLIQHQDQYSSEQDIIQDCPSCHLRVSRMLFCRVCNSNHCVSCWFRRHGTGDQCLTTSFQNTLGSSPNYKPYWKLMNFDLLATFQIIAADSLIGMAKYMEARDILQETLESWLLIANPLYCPTAMRLSKIKRRCDVSQSQALGGLEHVTRMTNGILASSMSVRRFYLDELETVFTEQKVPTGEIVLSKIQALRQKSRQDDVRQLDTPISVVDLQMISKLCDDIVVLALEEYQSNSKNGKVETETAGQSMRLVRDEEDAPEARPLMPKPEGVNSTRSDSMQLGAKNELILVDHEKIDSQPGYALKFTDLHGAIRNLDYELFVALLDDGADIEEQDRQNMTALHVAVECGTKGMVGALLDRDANIEAKDEQMQTSLHLAVRRSAILMVKLLLNLNPDIEARDEKQHTSLLMAARWSTAEIVGLLLDQDADIEASDKDGRTPLHVAVHNHLEDIAQTLLDRGADVMSLDNKEMTPLHLAADTRMAELLLTHDVDVNAKSRSGSTPLHEAARRGSWDIVELLIDQGADINAKSNFGSTPLHQAVENGARELIELLIDRGADINATSEYDSTPLHVAVENGARELSELLIDRGANIEARDKDGETPLHYAAERGGRDVVELLIDRGAKVDSVDVFRQTPLALAVYSNEAEVMKVLLSHGADANKVMIKKISAYSRDKISRDTLELLNQYRTPVSGLKKLIKKFS